VSLGVLGLFVGIGLLISLANGIGNANPADQASANALYDALRNTIDPYGEEIKGVEVAGSEAKVSVADTTVDNQAKVLCNYTRIVASELHSGGALRTSNPASGSITRVSIKRSGNFMNAASC
jgi:hypothetical protein